MRVCIERSYIEIGGDKIMLIGRKCVVVVQRLGRTSYWLLFLSYFLVIAHECLDHLAVSGILKI